MDSTSNSFRKESKGKLITKSASKDNLCSFEDITSIDYLSSDYEYDFEQTCLLKLKQQREKVTYFLPRPSSSPSSIKERNKKLKNFTQKEAL